MGQNFRIISPIYNARPWAERFIRGIRDQIYPDWKVVVIDDASDDGTYEYLCELAADEDRITVVRNSQRRLALTNVVQGIHAMHCDDEDVLVFLDGDDWFSDGGVLDYLNGVYAKRDVWITWGSYVVHPSGQRGRNARPLPLFHDVRKGHFIFSHLKTAKHFLWRNIVDADLRDSRTGDYYRASWDNVVMRPMIEMAGRRHSRFIRRVLYVYNSENPRCNQSVNPSLQKACKQEVYGRARYRRRTRQELTAAGRRRVILALTPWVEQKNLGDHAQALLIERWIRSQWPDAHFSEFDIRQTDKLLQEPLAPGDLIILCSGGNTGDVWIEAEHARRQILKTFRGNRIISLPQTIDFRDPREFETSKRIYNDHPDLTFCARDGYSYALAKEHFPNAKVLLAPDIVLTHKYERHVERKGVLLCLRMDRLSTLSREHAESLKASCEAQGYACRFINTRIDEPVPDREEGCRRMWDIFSASEGVISNRLHGTLFSVITGTPCVIIPPANHKISEMHLWLRDIPFVRFCHRPEEASEILRQVMDEPRHYDPAWAREYYAGLTARIDADRVYVKEEALLGLLRSCRSAKAWSQLKVPPTLIEAIMQAGLCGTFDGDAGRLRFRVISDAGEIADLTGQCLGCTDDPPSHIILVGHDSSAPASSAAIDVPGPDNVAAAIQNMRLYCETVGISTCRLVRPTSRQTAHPVANTVPSATFTTGIALGYAKDKGSVSATSASVPVAGSDDEGRLGESLVPDQLLNRRM